MLSRMICGKLSAHLGLEILAHDVAAERQRQAGLVLPPFAEVHDLREAVARVRELALVNDQSGVGIAALHRIENLVEGHHDVLEVRHVEAQRQEGARLQAGDGDLRV